ncbi:MAG: hypothetical protein WA964_04790 [Ilumatobacter sp.]|uniref:hypothetical protein n=1 Tax=Ilumatobacter sp. TaxID=1967498 RepID=UPI003C72A423
MGERLDRDAVDRVLARAHLLEAADPSDDAGGVGADALIAAATEVGIDPNAVRDSLAIERLSIATPPARRFDRLSGAGQIVIERELDLTVDQTISGLDAWLTSVHRLICDRRSAGSLFARRRSDAAAQLGRMLSTARGDGRLAATSLVVEAVPQVVGTTPARSRTLVRISADRATPRQVRLAGGGSLAGAGVAGGAAAATAATDAFIAFPAIAVPMTVVGYAVARSGRGSADRLELELERLVSRVERGERPTGFIGRIARRAKQAAIKSR